MIRKAEIRDAAAIASIYEHIHDEEEAGRLTTGWIRGVYPTIQTALDAVDREDMFVWEEKGRITASAILNQLQVPAYEDCDWEYAAPAEAVMVLHTLTVEPAEAGRGLGRGFVTWYEQYAAAHGCPFLRMDTNERNEKARRLYASLGYREPGIVRCTFNGIPGVRLVCLEKRLNGGGGNG